MAAKFNREAVLAKIQQVQKRLEAELKDISKYAEKIENMRGKIEKQISILKTQAKAVAEAERAKRRARRGS